MSRVRKFVDFLKEAGEVVAGAPVALATSGGILKVIGNSIANKAISGKIMKAGELLMKGGVKLAKIYGKGVAIGLKALGKSAKAATPVVKTVAKTLPGSRYVPGIIKLGTTAVPLYLTAAAGIKLAKEAQRVNTLTGSAINRLGSERPRISFQHVLNFIKDMLLFK